MRDVHLKSKPLPSKEGLMNVMVKDHAFSRYQEIFLNE